LGSLGPGAVQHYAPPRSFPALPEAILANALGDLWNWIAEVVGRIGDISAYWLVAALALKTAESAFIGLSWRGVLRAAYPTSNLSFKTAWGASQGGTAINAVVPAQAGTVVMIGIFRASIPGSSVAGLTSAAVVQALFFAATSVVIVTVVAIFLPHTVSKGSPSDEVGNFFATHPVLIGVVAVAVIGVVFFVWPRVKRRVADEWEKAKQGAAIFRDRRRYAREVALPSGVAYGCRMGVNMVFMAAFDIPVTVFTVFLVVSSHTLSQLFAITPGGVGQTQALDLVTLRRYAPTESIAACSVIQDSVITVWNVVLGIGVMLWAFGYTETKALLSKSRREHATSEP
jgi:uncharacterized membrane protein YbhN (UPF0104 family)